MVSVCVKVECIVVFIGSRSVLAACDGARREFHRSSSMTVSCGYSFRAFSVLVGDSRVSWGKGKH